MSTTTKEELELMMAFAFKEPMPIDPCYEVYESYVSLIAEADDYTSEYLWTIVQQDKKGLLRVRTSFAEKGHELTPDQCFQYMFILGTALSDSIGEAT